MDSQDFKFELAQHFINRKRIKEYLQLKNIQTLQNPPQIISDIVDSVNDDDHKKKYEIIKQELSKGYSDFRFLAKGAQAYVILAKEKQTNKRFAIKAYQVSDGERKDAYQNVISDACQEGLILLACSGSAYIANLIINITNNQNQFLYFVLTECQGTLQEIIDSTGEKKLNELSAIKYSIDIAEGLLHIHKNNYLVNDLKTENILIDYSGNAVVSDFGFAQKLKKNGYANKEQNNKGNVYSKAPECLEFYQEHYKKLNMETKMKPSIQSEACSLGYLIYTMVQGGVFFLDKKDKPLKYDDYFKSFKYSKQLQEIIDGLTKFKPTERLSVQDAFIKLKEIFSKEFNLDYKLQIEVSQQTQELSQNQLSGVEFIEKHDKKYYPIIKDEDSFLQELKKNCSKETLEKIKQLENLKNFQQEDQKNLKKMLKEKQHQIEEIQEKEYEIKGSKQKIQTKSQDVENLKNNQQNHGDSSLFLQQKQEEQILPKKMEESEKKRFQENQVGKEKKIQELEDNVSSQEKQILPKKMEESEKKRFQENQVREEKKIQELEDNFSSQEKCQCVYNLVEENGIYLKSIQKIRKQILSFLSVKKCAQNVDMNFVEQSIFGFGDRKLMFIKNKRKRKQQQQIFSMVFDEKVPKYFYPQNINQLKLDQGKEIKKSIGAIAGGLAWGLGWGLIRGLAISGAIAIGPIAGPIAAGAAAIGTLGNIYIGNIGAAAIGNIGAAAIGNIIHQRKCEVGKFCCNCKKKSKEACKHGCGCEFCKMP